MSGTYTMNAGAVTLGAGKIWVDSGSGWRPIGFTLDGQKVSYIPAKHEIRSDQFGDVPVNVILTGETVKVGFTMLETTKDNLLLAMPFGTLYTDGTNQAVGIGHDLYSSYYEKAVKVKIHPINTYGAGNTDDETRVESDYVFWKCVNVEAFEIGFFTGKERVYQVRLTVMPDTSKTGGYFLGIHGDPALTTLDTTPPSTVSEVASGTAQAGSATTITLAAAASSVDDYYAGMHCFVTGKGDAVITDYDGTSKVATVADWLSGADPTNGDTYSIHSKHVSAKVGATMTLIAPPEAELSNVAVNTTLEIVFSEALDAGSALNPANYILKQTDDNTVVALSASNLAYNAAAKKVTITPSSSLAAATDYELIVHGVKDTTGNAMTTPESVRFTTA